MCQKTPHLITVVLLMAAMFGSAGHRIASADVKTAPRAGSRGYLTTPAELAVIRDKAAKGKEPYASAVRHVLHEADQRWKWPTLSGRITCPAAHEPAYLYRGSSLVYAKALAFQLTGRAVYASEARAAIVGLLSITSFGEPGNSKKPDRQCQLNLSWAIPGFIRAADLLEGDSEWHARALKPRFQDWLAQVVYPVISFTAESRVNNWGAAATNASAYIADYLWDRPTINLVSYNALGAKHATTARSPADAYERANELALSRMNGTLVEGLGSNGACDLAPETKSMIRPDGGIPDELRRGSSGCDGTRVVDDDASNMYSQTYLQNLIPQAELLLRRGDARLYDNIQNDPLPLVYVDPERVDHKVTLPAGRGSLRKAILFVLDKPSLQRPRALQSAAEVAYRYYRDPAMLRAVIGTRPNSGERAMSFETLTHGFAEGENPGPPPVVAPPRN